MNARFVAILIAAAAVIAGAFFCSSQGRVRVRYHWTAQERRLLLCMIVLATVPMWCLGTMALILHK